METTVLFRLKSNKIPLGVAAWSLGTIFSLQVTSIENNYFWIQYFKSAGKDKPDKWTMQPKLYTALVSDFVSILPPPDLVD
jgi:hypothetical protein